MSRATHIGRSARRRPWRSAGVLFALLGLLAAPAGAEEAADEPPEGIPAIASSSDVITAIRFVGNRVTREQILRQEMLVKEGDIADPALIERSRQAIMDLGLFTSVRARLEPAERGSTLVISVKEKYYILPVPKLNRDEENHISLGAELTLDNLAGLNQQLKLRYENEPASAVSGGDLITNTLSYNYPRVMGGPWTFHSDISEVKSPAEVLSGAAVASLYEKTAWTVSAQMTRWLNLIGPSQGWQVGGGLVWRSNDYEYRSGATTTTFQNAQVVGVSVLAQFLDVHDYLYSRSGTDYGYAGEYGDPAFGSDTHYTRHELHYRRYILLDHQPHVNLDIQWKLGLSSGDLFPGDAYAYGLGGSKSLRGYDSGVLTGNAYMLLNVQYLHPLFGYNPLRGVVFMDLGNAYPSNTELHLGDLKWDAGVGLRVRLKSFVKLNLRVDVAYAHDTGKVKVYAGTGEMF